MSGINSAMLAGVTGLSANSAALASISDDIANVNTVGFKSNQTFFSDLVTNSAGTNYPSGGVQAISVSNVTQQGVLQSATSPTDLAISGQGFFVTSQGASSPSTDNGPLFTRAGAFSPNNKGYLVNAAGLYLQGWQADANGSIVTDPSNLALLQPINVTSISSLPVPTTDVKITANLQSSTPVSQASADFGTLATDAYDPTSATKSMAVYNATTGVGTKPDFTMQIPVSNSQGGTQTLQVNFLRSTTPNQWYAEVVSVPASAVTTGTGLTSGQVATGVIAFDETGTLDLSATTLPLSLAFGASSSAAPLAGASKWATGLGIGSQTVSIDLSGTGAALTQNDGASSVTSIDANGTPSGSLNAVQVDASGNVTAIFSNGVTRKIAQVAIATFANANGLTAVSGDAYQSSLASGTFNLKSAGIAGAGTISPSNLESSTVDLSAEFTNMITTQRAYSASSKIITTADNMLQDLISIIR